ncbi:MAG TPA: Coq4 family protein, partial [Pseudomonadales bacterium]|nr:Coq4 family protein [Pseudomonadales bacterium]
MAYKLNEALKALEALSKNPDDTAQAIRAIVAMSGNSGERLFNRFKRSNRGARILREKLELYDMLSDIDQLGEMPEGSLGHGIWTFYTKEELSAQGLKGASEAASDGTAQGDPNSDQAIFGRRNRELHDVFHVLTGYGRDMRGEMAVLAFTFAQTKSTGIGYMVMRSMEGNGWDSETGRLMRQGYWRGRRAQWL